MLIARASIPASSGIVSSSMSRWNFGTPRLDAQRLGDGRIGIDDAGCVKPLSQRACMLGLDQHVEAWFAGVGRAQHDRRLSLEVDAHVAMLRQLRQSIDRGADRSRDDGGGARSDDRRRGERVADVAQLHVLGEDELIEPGKHGRLDVARSSTAGSRRRARRPRGPQSSGPEA